MTVFALALLAIVPAAALFGVARSRFLKALGAVVVCYAAGVVLGNLGPAVDPAAAKDFSSACVALAIPLLLFSTDVPLWLRSARSTVVSFTLACAAVCLAAWFGGRMFYPRVPEGREVAAMLAGVYIGGTPNMSALAVALKVKQETFLIVNGADMILSSAYLIFLTTIGRKVLRTFLPAYVSVSGGGSAAAACHDDSAFAALDARRKCGTALASFAISAAIVGLSLGLSRLAAGRVDETTTILALTTFGVAGSFIARLRAMPGAFKVGNYLLLAFCAAVGAMTRLSSLMRGGWDLPLFVAVVITSSIILHLAAAAAFKIDAETVMITSTAAIMSPPFVVIVAAALDNEELLLPGITSGLVGYAIANYAGLALFRLLSAG